MDIITKNTAIAMTNKDIEIAQSVEDEISVYEEYALETHHNMHGGIYSRTMMLKKGDIVSGVIIKVPTTMVVSGHVKILLGSEVMELKGYNVLSASANRKQVVTALEDTYISMILKSDAQKQWDAEDDFTDEGDKLMSRQSYSINKINVSGE